MHIPRISAQQAHELFQAHSHLFMDIRDPHSFENGHILRSQHVNDHNIESFVDDTPKDQPIVVYCYHGNSSQGATAYLLEQGFENVASMDGGFSEWQRLYPEAVAATLE